MRYSQSQDSAFLKTVAEAISQRGLSTLALIVLEAGRPFSFLGGQFLWLAQPGLSILWPREKVGRLAHLLEKPDSVDALIAYLKAK